MGVCFSVNNATRLAQAPHCVHCILLSTFIAIISALRLSQPFALRALATVFSVTRLAPHTHRLALLGYTNITHSLRHRGVNVWQELRTLAAAAADDLAALATVVPAVEIDEKNK